MGPAGAHRRLLKDRTAPADVVLQRPMNAAPADRLAKALTALGSLVKTIPAMRSTSMTPRSTGLSAP